MGCPLRRHRCRDPRHPYGVPHQALESATNAERLDPHNGLLILPQYDRLFDLGYISFRDDGGILISAVLPRARLPLLGIKEDAGLSAVAAAHRPFLSFHRDRVFIRLDQER